MADVLESTEKEKNSRSVKTGESCCPCPREDYHQIRPWIQKKLKFSLALGPWGLRVPGCNFHILQWGKGACDAQLGLVPQFPLGHSSGESPSLTWEGASVQTHGQGTGDWSDRDFRGVTCEWAWGLAQEEGERQRHIQKTEWPEGVAWSGPSCKSGEALGRNWVKSGSGEAVAVGKCRGQAFELMIIPVDAGMWEGMWGSEALLCFCGRGRAGLE